MDRLKRFFNRSRKPIAAHEEIEMKEIGKSADKTGVTSTHSVTKSPEKPSWFARLKNMRFGRSKSLSEFKTSKASARDKATNTTIKTASKEHQRVAKEYLQKQGYKGNELKKIMNNLKSIPDEYYIEAVEDIPQKKFHDLGYTSQRVAIGDFDEAFAALLDADFSTKDAEAAILFAKENAVKNNFRESFREIIQARVDDAITSRNQLSEEEDNKNAMLNWASDHLLKNKVDFGSKQEARHILEDIYLTVSQEHHGRDFRFINDRFAEKVNEVIQPPDYEQTEVKRPL